MSTEERTIWQRYSPADSLKRFATRLFTVMVIVWAGMSVNIYWPFALDAPEQAADLISRMTPPAWPYFGDILQPLIETINIATLSTILATILAIPVAMISAVNLSPNKATLWLGRFIVVTSRSVNELVWGLIFVVFFGPGALAGVAALTCRSVGFTAKLIGEAIEEIDPGQVQAIEATGASRAKIFIYGILPQIMPSIFGTAVFRWDINIRQSAVIGLVGAGGIGVALNNSMNMFRWDYVTVIIMAIFVVVLASESLSAALRNRVS